MRILSLYRYAGVVRSVVTETPQLLSPLEQTTIKFPVGRELLERVHQRLCGGSLVEAETFEDPSDHDSRSSEGLAREATAGLFALVTQLARNAEAELIARGWVDPYGIRPAPFEAVTLGNDQRPSAPSALREGDEIAGPPHVCVRLEYAPSGTGDHWLIAFRAVDDNRSRWMRQLKSHMPKLAELHPNNRGFGVTGTAVDGATVGGLKLIRSKHASGGLDQFSSDLEVVLLAPLLFPPRPVRVPSVT